MSKHSPKPLKKSPKGHPESQWPRIYGLLSIDYRLICGIVACYFGLLGQDLRAQGTTKSRPKQAGVSSPAGEEVSARAILAYMILESFLT